MTIPGYKVKLNGHLVDNAYREYPLLVYKDITYFPMTWYDSRLLGLEASWSEQEGLQISQGKVASAYVSYNSDDRNSASYRAEVPASAITVNGQTIDNTKEEYPLLSFRDVTYFPLTWRFAHDKFNWDYTWDTVDGLSIQSHNPQLAETGLPDYASENDVALFKGYYYFAETTGNTNQVYRAPVLKPSEKELVYSYDFLGVEPPRKTVHFRILDNELWFSYFVGSNLMGSNVYVKVNNDGKGEMELQKGGYTDFKKTPYGNLIIGLGPNDWEDNLSLAASGQKNQLGKAVGNPNLLYGRHVDRGNSSFIVDGIGTGDFAAVIGDDVYIMASTNNSSNGYSDWNKIYKIDLKTNETKKIVNTEVRRFRILGDKLYYVKDADNALYSSTLEGTGERKLSENAVSWFDGIDGNVYYTTAVGENAYRLYQANPDGEDPPVLQKRLVDVQLLNGKFICRFGEKEDYGAMVLDGFGRQVLALAEPISHLLPTDDAILFTISGDYTIKVIR
ncbi:DUF5050 domain-containing protein [Paenibacillus frigoriresistens]|uniref:DUF5050 domain-containing protein n=1 Tax=Paenibacillus alginolyticus TaxID=59839 RepID=UPI001563EC1C|nr:DUF5050 domain-containing protein [Paenibacillus frigoriresistens]NRF93069.1 DUF5050 domain-containing protein [Paenibacillus frigoriresistens]